MVEKQVTISVVAARAGVSVASVSRFLNDDVSVSDTMRAKVERAIHETGYTPLAAARSLRGGRTRQISLAVEDIGNPAYVKAMRSLQAVAQERGYRLLVESTQGIPANEVRLVRDLRQSYVDGLVLASTRFDPLLTKALAQAAVPVVVIGSFPDGTHVDSVGADAKNGAVTAVAHLVEQGCRHLVMVAGPAETLPSRNRAQGFLDGVARFPEVTSSVLHCPSFSREAGLERVSALLNNGTHVDGILAANDELAIGALHACQDAGRKIPEDVAIVGMDNAREGQFCRPALTTVDLKFEDRGQLAGHMLFDRIEHQYQGAFRRQLLQPELMVRTSSRRNPV